MTGTHGYGLFIFLTIDGIEVKLRKYGPSWGLYEMSSCMDDDQIERAIRQAHAIHQADLDDSTQGEQP